MVSEHKQIHLSEFSNIKNKYMFFFCFPPKHLTHQNVKISMIFLDYVKHILTATLKYLNN